MGEKTQIVSIPPFSARKRELLGCSWGKPLHLLRLAAGLQIAYPIVEGVMARPKRVIAVGVDIANCAPRLLNILRGSGYQLVEVPAVQELLSTPQRLGDAVIVVSGPQSARQLLGGLAQQRQASPVIVLVQRPDLDEYYSLMEEGAFDYFELGGEVTWIERSVQRAAAR
jgi:FixJ family two-component response regulator